MNKYYTIAKNNDLHTPIEIFSSIDLAKDKARMKTDAPIPLRIPFTPYTQKVNMENITRMGIQ